MTEVSPGFVRPRRHPMAKVALLLLAIFVMAIGGVCLIPAMLQKYLTTQHRTRLSDEVRQVSAKIADVKLPDTFEPVDAIEVDQFGATTRAVIWKTRTGAYLLLAELPQPFDPLAAFDVQSEAANFSVFDFPVEVRPYYFGGVTTDTVEVEIHGEKIEFQVQTPANPTGIGIPVPTGGDSELNATFPTKSRQRALLLLRVSSTELSKEQLIDIAKSVK